MVEKVTDPKRIVTDELVLKRLAKQGIDKDYVEFFQDYAPRWRKRADGTSYRVKEGSPYAKFYRDLKSGKKIMIVGGLPMINADGVKICGNSHNETTVGWEKRDNTYHTKPNVFSAKVTNKRVTLNCINDQPWGAKRGETVTWRPQLFLNNGEIDLLPNEPNLLPTDPINENYHNNVLEWDYGISKRRIRIIEGRFRERWLFESNPHSRVLVKHNFIGGLKLRLGYSRDAEGSPLQVSVIGDEEIIEASEFDKAVYPVEIGTEQTFYPDADPETATVDGYVYHGVNNSTWAAIRDGTGTGAADDGITGHCVYIRGGTNTDTWYFIARGIFLFDTSGLPDNAVIGAATLSLYGDTKSDIPGWAPDVNVYSSEPASNVALVAGDYDSLGTTPLSSAITYANFSTAGYNDFALNASGIAEISRVGISKFGSRGANYDVANSPPTWMEAYATLYAWQAEKGAGYKPKLVITYTLPGWSGKISGVTNPAKVTEVDKTNINKVKGVASA